jgi:hypothetical protein
MHINHPNKEANFPSIMNPTLFCSRGAFSICVVSLVVLVLLTASTSFVVSAQDAPYIIHTYHADISPLSDMYDVSGYVVLFTKSDTDASSPYLGYAGMVDNIESNLTYATCTAVNGCGVHVHSGKSCFNSTTPGGHYYNNLTIDVDPWIDARYFTNDDGMSSSFSGLLDIGSTDIDGRAFVGKSMTIFFFIFL